MDSHYLRIGEGIRTASLNASMVDHTESSLVQSSIEKILQKISNQNRQYATMVANRRARDIDIYIMNPEQNTDPMFIVNGWVASHLVNAEQVNSAYSSDSSEKLYTGPLYQVVEYEDETEHDGGSKTRETYYEGWKLETGYAYDDTPVVMLRAGIFRCPHGFNPDKEHSLEPVKITLSIDLTSPPKHFDPSDTRNGAVSIADKKLWLPVKSMSKSDMKLVVTPPFTWAFNTQNYGRYKINLIDSKRFTDHLPSLIERITRSIKHTALRVGLFDISDSVAKAAEETINKDLWNYISPTFWFDELQPTLFATAHLSPLALAVHLIPDNKLDGLPNEVKKKLAIHCIDHSLSLGKLWPAFKTMSDEQVAVFLESIPDQETYLTSYCQNPDIPINQGLSYIMRGLQKAGLKIPEFNGNILLQAEHVFRHPEDHMPLLMEELDILANVLRTINAFDNHHLLSAQLNRIKTRLARMGSSTDGEIDQIIELLDGLISTEPDEED